MSAVSGGSERHPVVNLVPVTRENWHQARALSVRPDQESFVPPVIVSLAKVGIRPGGPEDEHRPYAVMDGSQMVGFGELSGAFGSWETLWLGGFLVDARFQQQGYGRAALAEFVDLARGVPACRTLGLTVHPENAVAQRLYRSRGFETRGELFEGEVVYRLPLVDAEQR